jgi:hypothetical protein
MILGLPEVSGCSLSLREIYLPWFSMSDFHYGKEIAEGGILNAFGVDSTPP